MARLALLGPCVVRGWLSWKCGASLTTAHEHVRVAQALPGLPGAPAAFAAGQRLAAGRWNRRQSAGRV